MEKSFKHPRMVIKTIFSYGLLYIDPLSLQV